MRTALDAPPEALDNDEQSFIAKVRAHGWFRTNVFGDAEGPGFTYSTGFWLNASHPEVIIFSMKSEVAHDVIWDLFKDAKAGKPLPIGERTDAVFANLQAYAFDVAKKHYRDLLGWSRWFYGGDDFQCLQIIWPDGAGRFPWEPDFDTQFRDSQPDLTERGWVNELAD